MPESQKMTHLDQKDMELDYFNLDRGGCWFSVNGRRGILAVAWFLALYLLGR